MHGSLRGAACEGRPYRDPTWWRRGALWLDLLRDRSNSPFSSGKQGTNLRRVSRSSAQRQCHSGMGSSDGFAADKPFADSDDAAISGLSNRSPRRKHRRSGVQRKTVAFSSETECGNCALLTNAIGTSRQTWVLGSKYRFVASRTPLADRFSAVANSRNSSPVGFLPWTNIGIESGKRSHSRRSAPDAAVGTLGVSISTPNCLYSIPHKRLSQAQEHLGTKSG